jgi:hypothetical protein
MKLLTRFFWFALLTGTCLAQCPPTPLPFVNNFDSPTLDSCWFWIREDTSHWSLTERPGWMRIVTQDGFVGYNNNSNMLLRRKPMAPFTVETKLVITPAVPYQNGQLVLWEAADKFIHLYRHADVGGGQMICFQGAAGSGINSCASFADSLTWLRLTISGDLVSAYFARDASSWLWLGSAIQPWVFDTNAFVGLSADNNGAHAPEIPVDFDYFRVDPLPGTNVCGNVSGVWDSAGSPYYVTCDVTVPADSTLEIRPGVQVLFTGHYKFNVFGNLQAIGTEEDSIVFTRAFPTEESKGWGIRFNNADPACSLAYCIIEQGRTSGGPWDGDGGGVFMTESSPAFCACFIRNNSADYDGGGVACYNECSPRFYRTRIENNTARIDAGGVLFHTNCIGRMDSCVVRENVANGSAGGGGIYLHNSQLVMSFSHIANNRSENAHGGGVAAFYSGSRLTVTNCVLDSNYAHDDGGAVLANYSPFVHISACEIIGNRSGTGTAPNGIVELGVDTALVDHCGFYGNQVENTGGAVTVLSGMLRVTNCTFFGNSSCGQYSVVHQYGGSPAVRNCIAWNNTGSPLSGSITCAFSDIQGGYSGAGNIDADPMFVDTANGDFHLQAGSPCIDTGDPSSPYDPDSTRADMGAYPYFYPCLLVDRDSLEYGLLDLGTDSTMQVVLRNPTSQAIAVTDVSCSLPEFTFDTTGMGGQIAAFATFDLGVTFSPSSAGDYADTLTIIAQQECDSLIQIPMHGEAEVILPVVEGLVIQKGAGNDIQLDWQPVTHSISGQPLESVGYTVYGSTSREGPYVPFGYVSTNSFVHTNILSSRPTYFYYVTADIPSRRR